MRCTELHIDILRLNHKLFYDGNNIVYIQVMEILIQPLPYRLYIHSHIYLRNSARLIHNIFLSEHFRILRNIFNTYFLNPDSDQQGNVWMDGHNINEIFNNIKKEEKEKKSINIQRYINIFMQ